MLYLKGRKNESRGAMLMLSIYVYLLQGWRQRELSNTLVGCLEDLRIKLKPAEVSCKSCCASLGARIVCRVLVTVKYSSWEKPGSAQCCQLPRGWGRSSPSQGLQQRPDPRRGGCSSAGRSQPREGHAYCTAWAGTCTLVGAGRAWPHLSFCLLLCKSCGPQEK